MKESPEKKQKPKEPTVSLAAKILTPLLDALNYNGDKAKILQSMVNNEGNMDINDLVDTMANLNFHHRRIRHIRGKQIDKRILPVLLVSKDNYLLIINIGEQHALVYNAKLGIYSDEKVEQLKGDVYSFKYAADMAESILKSQENWFTKLIMRFGNPLKLIIGITFLLTLLDLLIPVFIILIYEQIGAVGEVEKLIVLLVGVIAYFLASTLMMYYRATITNYISSRMGNVISQQTIRQLLYLTPGYTEKASIHSQINRIKDFENLKRFTNSGIFLNLIELLFASVYLIAIFVLGGWIGVIPIVTFIIVILLGIVMRPFHKIRMERATDARNESQQNLLELLKNSDEIRASGMKEHWIQRSKTMSAKSIYAGYQQTNYAVTSNNAIYFITNASVIAVIYGGVLRVFQGNMSMGALIGVILIYWKVLAAIRGASSLFVQMNGLTKSIGQINRFMKLPMDTNLYANMVATKSVQGKVWFQDVSIRYKQLSKASLINVSFIVNQGEIMGITGHDGAGKTTILKLILGMYIPQGGRIIIDNNNIKQLEPLTLRQSISYCAERDFILSGTIRSNFRAVNPLITDQKIIELYSLTGMQQYMDRLSFTLDTELNEAMIYELSPSFKKIFCLTRMLAREVNLYLLDEPENHLGKEDMEKLVAMILFLSKKRNATVVISTKNEELLRQCQKVVALNQGRVIQNV